MSRCHSRNLSWSQIRRCNGTISRPSPRDSVFHSGQREIQPLADCRERSQFPPKEDGSRISSISGLLLPRGPPAILRCISAPRVWESVQRQPLSVSGVPRPSIKQHVALPVPADCYTAPAVGGIIAVTRILTTPKHPSPHIVEFASAFPVCGLGLSVFPGHLAFPASATFHRPAKKV